MPRLVPLHWEKIICVFNKLGYQVKGQKGSHIKLEKPGVARPLIVPKYTQVGVPIISGLIKTAGINREAFFDLLERC